MPGRRKAPAQREVLVVDDNPIARATAVSLLRDLGCKVMDAYNGEAALQVLEANPGIEVLFVDVRMPGMSGPELADAALRTRPDLRVVFTSAYANASQLPASAHFVPKPWSVDTLARAVVEDPT